MISPSAFYLLLISVSLTLALECYVCHNQEDNKNKCVKTIKTCEQDEDVCLTEVRWGSTPYWTQGALKQHYISKRCSSKDKCERYRRSNMGTCTHIWYDDWKCSDCCKGDRCNYYVFSGSENVKIHKVLYAFSILVPVLFIKVF